jgi:hypothetical protein
MFKSYVIRKYNKGESGNPCFRSLEDLKKGVGQWLIEGVIQGLLIQALIQDIKDGLKPIFLRMQ